MSQTTGYRILFAGGGTGGHLYPAIAIADRLKAQLGRQSEVEIRFVGTKRGLEYRLGNSLGYPLTTIAMRGIVRRLSLKNLLVPFAVAASLIQSFKLITSFNPQLVVGTGGYVAWPVVRMAAFRNIPVVIQEQNSFPGIVTRRAAGFASRIYLGFAGAQNYLQTKAPMIVTGNPVRDSLTHGDRQRAVAEFGLDPHKKTILILGGSQGASAINNAVLKSLANASLSAGMQLLWQTGKRDYTEIAAVAGDKVSTRALFPFSEKMPLVYAAADFAIARAGALTLAELSVCGLPALLIPYPIAAGDHQRKNAEECVANGTALMITEDTLDSHDVLKEASNVIQSEKFMGMRVNIRSANAGKRPALDMIAEDIITLLKEQKGRA